MNKYEKAMNNVHISDDGKERILKNIELTKKERAIMSKRKFAVVAAAAVMILGITVFAASGIITSWHSYSTEDANYKELPTQEQCIKDVGFAPVLIEEFENGYAFDEGTVVKNSLEDANGKSVEKFKSLNFTYTKDDDTAYITQDKYSSDIDNAGEIISSENGIDIYYYSYTNKIVPPDYELTDEDKKAEANGELVFSYGSSEVQVMEIQSASWESEGIHYSIMQMDGKLTQDELVEMAKEMEANK